ncbi:GIY-YIG nuclease family protein [Mesobacillus maritimus]|uniref:GIY-YIG nuclease family protein n=1 Tax=Mesobacillus maritimus TaxID=1643336 RepID=UPI00203D0A15|nr:GIY-YIG nuclease family protein [Mesobacillus maritimus]MCM3671053.1 GIY-YIG nuclease family protein [Mesobacillus maritimus]
MKEVFGVIYLATNKINGKKYVGQTLKGRLERRIEEHLKDSLNPKTVFQYAIKKHGIDNFHFEVIDQAFTSVELNQKEHENIVKYNTYYRNGKGYNMTLGKEGLRGIDNGISKLTENDVVKIREMIINRVSQRKIAKEFGVTKNVIALISQGKIWVHVESDFTPPAKMDKFDANRTTTDEQIISIKKMIVAGCSYKEIMKKNNVTKNIVNSIKSGESWAHIEVEGFKPQKPGKAKGEGVGTAKIRAEDAKKIKELIVKGLKNKEIINSLPYLKLTSANITPIRAGRIWSHIKVEGFVPGTTDNRGSNNGVNVLTEADVIEIKKHLKNKTKTKRELSKEFPVSYQTIWKIEKGEAWSHIEI